MRQCVYTRDPRERVHVFDATAMPWEPQARAGLATKTIRVDDDRGEFLGLIRFDAFVRSAVHQHQGVASSFILDGEITDYGGPVPRNAFGINVLGSTHDAMAYVPTILVSKLEGPVRYPPSEQMISGIHAGSSYEAFRNPAPDVPPELSVAVDAVSPVQTGVAGLARQPVFDYAGTGHARRLLQWRVRPECAVPEWRASDWVEMWVRGGELVVNDETAYANCFVVVEPGATVRMSSPFGALVVVWSEGRESLVADSTSDAASVSLFGY